MILTAETLPDNPTDLKQVIVDMQERHKKQISLLMVQIRLLRHQIYGVKSEKLSADSTVQLLPLFDMPEPEEFVRTVENEYVS